MDSERKACTKCGEEKPIDGFLFRKDRGRHSTVCRTCTNTRLLARLHANPGLASKYYQQYKTSNPDSYKRRITRANAKRYGTPRGKLDALIRNAVYRSLAGTRKQASTYEALGYSLDTLKQHLERQFQRGMSWENYGEWHVDHIVPLAEFEIDGTDSAGFRAAWALGNLRPLWATENILKRDKRTHLL